MKTMEEVIRERMLEVCEEQLRALRSAVGGTIRAQIVLTITPESPTTKVSVRPLVQQGWYSVWSK